MKLGYEKLLEKQNLSATDLSNDLKLRIKEITQLKNLILSKRKIGQNVSPITIEKLKEKDSELIDLLIENIDEDDLDEDDINETDSDESENDPESSEDFGDEQIGISIDTELKNFSNSGKTETSLENMSNLMPNTYNLIWETYEENEENGISTSNFDFFETENNSQKFKIVKK
jgi:hypothetical protein